MSWLDRLEAIQKPEPNIFTPPRTEVSKVSKAPEPETTKAVAPENLPHYCEHGDCWCSEKLPGSNYPAGCIRINCEYHQAASQAAIDAQGMLPPAPMEDAA